MTDANGLDDKIGAALWWKEDWQLHEPILCRQCDRVLEDGPDICEDCAWDIHDQLDGWTPDD